MRLVCVVVNVVLSTRAPSASPAQRLFCPSPHHTPSPNQCPPLSIALSLGRVRLATPTHHTWLVLAACSASYSRLSRPKAKAYVTKTPTCMYLACQCLRLQVSGPTVLPRLHTASALHPADSDRPQIVLARVAYVAQCFRLQSLLNTLAGLPYALGMPQHATPRRPGAPRNRDCQPSHPIIQVQVKSVL
jgi:hypothetical protein